MKQEVSPRVVAAALGVVALVAAAAALFAYGPLKRVPPPPSAKPVSGGPGIPRPLPADQIRHGPIGS